LNSSHEIKEAYAFQRMLISFRLMTFLLTFKMRTSLIFALWKLVHLVETSEDTDSGKTQIYNVSNTPFRLARCCINAF